jgi:hypothetical protein
MAVSNVIPLPPRGADPVVLRELRRTRALRAVGWLDDVCADCKRKLWHRAGAENLAASPGHPDREIAAALGDKPDYLADVGAALGSEAGVLREISERKILTDSDRARMRLLAARLVRVSRLLAR